MQGVEFPYLRYGKWKNLCKQRFRLKYMWYHLSNGNLKDTFPSNQELAPSIFDSFSPFDWCDWIVTWNYELRIDNFGVSQIAICETQSFSTFNFQLSTFSTSPVESGKALVEKIAVEKTPQGAGGKARFSPHCLWKSFPCDFRLFRAFPPSTGSTVTYY